MHRGGELGRHDPYRRGLGRGDLRERLQILVGKQRRIRRAFVDRLEHGRDRLRLTFGAQDVGFALVLRGEDVRLLLALSGQDLRLFLAFRGEDHCALLPVGAHLLLHRLLHACRWVDRLDLDPVDPDPPLAGGLF